MLPADALPSPPPGRSGWPWESRAPLPELRRGHDWPRITVVTPSYNQGEYIEATLRSVVLQDYPNLEHLLLDGKSTDDSVSIIRRYEPWLTSWRSEKDGGQAAAIASGFAMATGEILCWLNSDDIFLPGALRAVGAYFAAHRGVDVLYGNRLVIDRDGAVTGRHVWPWRLTRAHWALGQPMAQEATFWRRSIYERVGGLDTSKFFIMDYDLFFRMWRAGTFRKTSRYLGCLRIHEETKNTRHVDVWQRELAEARARYGLRVPGYVGSRVLNRMAQAQLMIESLLTKDVQRNDWGLTWTSSPS
ncbi:MAG TPA: glycosyltransferase family 2 protein [Thermoanaerobaculia bacterium]|jgi:glycosyltransferase involved in cell wall biosynthesis